MRRGMTPRKQTLTKKNKTKKKRYHQPSQCDRSLSHAGQPAFCHPRDRRPGIILFLEQKARRSWYHIVGSYCSHHVGREIFNQRIVWHGVELFALTDLKKESLPIRLLQNTYGLGSLSTPFRSLSTGSVSSWPPPSDHVSPCNYHTPWHVTWLWTWLGVITYFSWGFRSEFFNMIVAAPLHVLYRTCTVRQYTTQRKQFGPCCSPFWPRCSKQFWIRAKKVKAPSEQNKIDQRRQVLSLISLITEYLFDVSWTQW